MSDGVESAGRGAGMLVIGVVAGVLLLGTARFLAMPESHAVHYHANWAVFIDGERLDLTANRYMEDIGSCSVDPTRQRPEDRVHMHEANQDVVHVHASGVSWGHFLANLRFAVGDDFLVTDRARYDPGDGRTLKFILNGQAIRSIANRAIGDEDRLLISFGAESEEEVAASQFAQVASTAGTFNTMPDPASCSGPHEHTTGEKLRAAFWF